LMLNFAWSFGMRSNDLLAGRTTGR
jgi:hypothetical protein